MPEDRDPKCSGADERTNKACSDEGPSLREWFRRLNMNDRN